MVKHYTTADGCERWENTLATHGFDFGIYEKVPIRTSVVRDEKRPFSTPREDWSYRLYKLESVEFGRGIAHYVEVQQ